MKNGYAVVLLADATIPPQLLESVFVDRGNLVRQDARQIAFERSPIIGENFTHEQATCVQHALQKLGYACVAVASSEIPQLPKSELIPWIAFSATGFGVPLGLNRTFTVFEWPSVFLISSANMSLPEPKRVLERAANSEDTVNHYVTKSVAKPTFVTEVLALSQNERLCNLRLLPDHTHDRCQSAASSTAAATSPRKEFSKLLQHVVSHCSTAAVSKTTRHFLNETLDHFVPNANEEQMHFQEKAFQLHNRWQLFLVLHRERQITD